MLTRALIVQRHVPRALSTQYYFFHSGSTTAAKVKASEVKVGNVLSLEDDSTLAMVKKSTIVKPGKGGAFNNLELTTMSGRNMSLRLRTTETVEKVRLDRESYQVLYLDGDTVHLMHDETFEQLSVELPSVLPEQKQHPFVQDGVKLELLSYESNPISVALPNKVEIEVAVTEPQPKGATIKVGAFKSCELSNGVSIMIPPFVNTGDMIEVNPNTLEYVGRVSK
ncbi:hypothetical protein TrCOL_g4517 [Triparma columacea]|uniref:Elongation factor P n=1 Tax=Triparma columacea TaxID=722753 RepID=A0A9W7L177_9STRA|nr:hypothetical protein TrCOL_g4517 [Triparma columacea]